MGDIEARPDARCICLWADGYRIAKRSTCPTHAPPPLPTDRSGGRALSTLYQTPEDFYEAEVSDQATLRDGSSHLWLIWCDEQGDWWGCRPRDEDDGPSSQDGSLWAPIGPEPLDLIPTPWLVSIPDYQSTDQGRR